MPMTEQQFADLKQWLNRKTSNYACPFCHQNDWQVGEIVALPVVRDGAYNPAGPAITVAQLVCKNCGYVVSFNEKMVNPRS